MNKNIDKELNETKEVLCDINSNDALEYAIWVNEKARIKFTKFAPTFPITSNYIYWCNLGINIGSEQNKIRPVIIVKTKYNSDICTILPLTSERTNDSRWYHIDLDNQNSTVLIEQLRNISKSRIISPYRIKGKLSKITLNDWNRINNVMQKYYIMTKWK